MEYKLEKFTYKERVDDLGETENSTPGPVYKYCCAECHQDFKTANTYSIKRHLFEKHGHVFIDGRKRKPPATSVIVNSVSEVEDAATPSKKLRCNCPKLPYSSGDEFIKDCVRHHVMQNQPFTYWDADTTRNLYSIYEKKFNVSIRSRKMREHLVEASHRISYAIEQRLHNRLFSLKFDIGSRFNRSFLGVAVQ